MKVIIILQDALLDPVASAHASQPVAAAFDLFQKDESMI